MSHPQQSRARGSGLSPAHPSQHREASRQYRLVFGGKLESQLGSKTRGWLCESVVVSQSPIFT